MKKIVFVLAIVLMLISCTSIKLNSGYEYMTTVDDTDADNGDWVSTFFVDEFKNYTNSAYIKTSIINGSFTNTVTNGSELDGSLLVTADEVQVVLLEYGSYPLSVVKDYPTIVVKVKAGTEVYETSFNKVVSKRVVITDAEPVFRLLTQYDEVQFYISILDYTESTYNFTVSGKGFTHAYKTTFVK